MIMSYLWMRVDPLDSLYCSTFARVCACSAVAAALLHRCDLYYYTT